MENKIGIEQIGFFIPNLYITMDDLAAARDVDPNKFKIGIGQDEQAVAPLSQDIVTLGVNATLEWFQDEMKDKIGLLIFGTESSIDESKAAAMYVKSLLGINDACRCFEIKEACYGATAGLMTAIDFVKNHPNKKAIVIGSDIARYGLNTSGEVTQGAGAVAMLISNEPKIISFNDITTVFSKNIMDFWRPSYQDTAIVDGHYSVEQYLKFFQNVWKCHNERTGLNINDYNSICFHLPFTKQGLKALNLIIDSADNEHKDLLMKNFINSTLYGRRIGNTYTASLYISFISLLENSNNINEEDLIGFFSYGSGAVSEFFTGKILNNYKDYLHISAHEELFKQRKKLSIKNYEKIFNDVIPHNLNDFKIDVSCDLSKTVLSGIKDKKRVYIKR